MESKEESRSEEDTVKPETRSGEEATVEGLEGEAEELWSNPLRFITFPPAPSTDALQDTQTQTHTDTHKRVETVERENKPL